MGVVISLKKKEVKMNRKSNNKPFGWNEFFMEEIVNIENGKRLTKNDMKPGNIPFIGASEQNNGVTAYTSSKNESIAKNVLGVNYNGSVGFSFYHPYEAIFSDDVKRVSWKDESHNNKYTLLFLSSMIKKQKDKYAYGYKFNSQRMKRQKLLLPVREDSSIDWQFMEDYMRQKEKEILEPTIEKLCKRLIDNEILGGVNPWRPSSGKNSTLQMYSLKYNEESGSRKQTIRKEKCLMCHPRLLTTELIDTLEMMAA